MSASRGDRTNQRRRWKKRHPDKLSVQKAAWRDRYRLGQSSVKVKAHAAVYRALKRGELVRPSECMRCGVSCKPEAHHPDYSRPLVVAWLCGPCHRMQEELRSDA